MLFLEFFRILYNSCFGNGFVAIHVECVQYRSMILQTDKKLPTMINKYGCYMMSMFFLAGQQTSISYDAKGIIAWFEKWKQKGFVDDECTILNPDGIFGDLGVRTKYTQTHEPPEYVASEDEFEIQAWNWKFTHFVAARSGIVAYDPLGESWSVKNGVCVSKRIFKVL